MTGRARGTAAARCAIAWRRASQLAIVAFAVGCASAYPAPPPRIGITGATAAIERAVADAGGIPVALAPGERHVDGLDALVLGPGLDLDPGRYGELPAATTLLVAPEREDQDLALSVEAFANDLPVLGLCLGAQAMAVSSGASLIQDVPTEIGEVVAHRAEHAVEFEGSTPLFGWYGASVVVADNHHQAVDGVPPGARIAAVAADGVTEAFWFPERSFAVGVQFHPELAPERHVGLWAALVDAARRPPRASPLHPDPPPPALPTCAEVNSPFLGDRRSLAELRARYGSGFGDDRVSYVRGHRHGGIDLKTHYSESVYAICAGRVADIHLSYPHLTVQIEHHLPDGHVVYSSYKHVADVSVHIGDPVGASTPLGRVFNEEEQRGAGWKLNHLHFEMRSSIADGGAASWTSMTMDELKRYAFDPAPFFAAHLRSDR